MEHRKSMQQENDKKKVYLQSYKYYKQTAERLKEQLEELQIHEMSPTLFLSDMPSTHNKRDLSDYIVKYDELFSEIINAHTTAVKRFEEIRNQIELLEDGNEKTVLTLRYLKAYDWENICEKMQYSCCQVHRIHRGALEHFQIVETI